jgi:hypothetical protein
VFCCPADGWPACRNAEAPGCSRTNMHLAWQPKPSLFLRISAGAIALLWFVSLALSGIGRTCMCAGPDGKCAAHALSNHAREDVAVEHGHSGDAEAHNNGAVSENDEGAAPRDHCDRNGCEEKCRCESAIQPSSTTVIPFVILKPVSPPVLNFSFSSVTRACAFAAGRCEPVRPTRFHHWVFTPEVCLGPAFRSHAPPVSV